MSLVSEAFLEHLRTNNSAGLEAVWGRSAARDRPELVATIHASVASSEAHLFLHALVDGTRDPVEQQRLVQVGIDALSDLASRGSSDRVTRLAQWARAGEVREALLTMAAQRGEKASNELVEWLASADDDALTDALIPVFLGAVASRDGARLELLSGLAERSGRLRSVKPRYDALKGQSRDEWRSFVGALGLEQEAPFSMTCHFRAGEPAITLAINPVRLNWYQLTWGPFVCDSTRRLVEGVPFDTTVPILELPTLVHAAMGSLSLKGRRKLHTSGGATTEARLNAWLARSK